MKICQKRSAEFIIV